MDYFIGMDIGGTYARLRLVNDEGLALYECEGQGGTISSCGVETMKDRFHALVQPALETCGLSALDCSGLCLGASGVDSPSLKRVYEEILEGLGFSRAVFQAYNDCEMLLSLFGGPCIVLVSGTGSIAMGRLNPTSPLIRCGGWSYLLSDEGSAPSISFAAMRAILKHWDGQCCCATLAELFAKSTGYDTPQQLTSWCHQNLQNKDQLARLAPLVEQAALAGDPCAQALQARAAQQLFELVDTVAHKLKAANDAFSLLLWGSVLTQNVAIRRELCRLTHRSYPRSQACMLGSSALDCAVQLAMHKPAQGLLRPAESQEAC